MPPASSVPDVLLNDGRAIPQLGFGVFQLEEARAPEIVGEAIRVGYRSIDTAAIYGNEAGVGHAVATADIPRDDLFLTTKLWNAHQGYDETLRAFDESVSKLGIEAVDLYLIHWPCPDRGSYVATWKAFVQLARDGRARSIGVSNFTADHLDRIVGETGTVPAVNQVELHPHFQQTALRQIHDRLGIVTESWSPLGKGKELTDPALVAIAERLGRTPAQVVLRWHIQNGLVAIPKTATPSRISENFDVFDFALSDDDLQAIARLDRPAGRIGPDPLRFG